MFNSFLPLLAFLMIIMYVHKVSVNSVAEFVPGKILHKYKRCHSLVLKLFFFSTRWVFLHCYVLERFFCPVRFSVIADILGVLLHSCPSDENHQLPALLTEVFGGGLDRPSPKSHVARRGGGYLYPRAPRPGICCPEQGERTVTSEIFTNFHSQSP